MRPTPDAIAQEQASIEVLAPPELVYDLLSRIDRMGEWSPEAVGGEWLAGGHGRVGDWFQGHNRSGAREWSRDCEVAAARPGREFTFVVGGAAANCTWWSYEMEPSAEGGTLLTERWWMVNKTPAMEAATAEQFAARVELTRSMLVHTLSALKAAAEDVVRQTGEGPTE